MATIVTVGIDLAKNVLAVHGVDKTGKPALVRPEVPHAKPLERMAHLPPRLIGRQARVGAHHRAREFAKLGHAMLVVVPKFRGPSPRDSTTIGFCLAKVDKPLWPDSSRSALARCRTWTTR